MTPSGVGGGREVQEGGDTGLPRADSCGCMAETSFKALILHLKTNTFKILKNFALLEFSSLKKLERLFTPAETNIITKHLISDFLIYLSFPEKRFCSSHKSLFSLHPSTELGTEACSFNHLASHTFVVSCI